MQRKLHVTSNICFHLHYKILFFAMMTVMRFVRTGRIRVESLNCSGWKSPLGGSRAATGPGLPQPPLTHVPRCHICTLLDHSWDSDPTTALGSLWQIFRSKKLLLEEPFPTAALDSEKRHKRHKVVPKCVRNSVLGAQPEVTWVYLTLLR